MAQFKIAFVNASTAVTDEEARVVMSALQVQVHRDFAPQWGIDADLIFVPRGQLPLQGMWWIAVLDTADMAGSLGYHDRTEEGLPLGKVFVLTNQMYGNQWTVSASHELLEMLVDPAINLAVFEPRPNMGPLLYSYEICDPCEADRYGYLIDQILVSDFVFPEWFESFRKPENTQFDFVNAIHQPFGLLEGGYIGIYDLCTGAGWQQLLPPGTAPAYPARPRVGSRRERRRTQREQWQVSRISRSHP